MKTDDVTPDPKPPPRIVDRLSIQRAKLLFPWCAACGAGPDVGLNGHHVLGRGLGGDDVIANIVCLCGTGTMRCHGAHHGNPYMQASVGGVLRRVDAEWVDRRIGETLLSTRRDVVAYLVRKLGDAPARDFLRRTYHARW